MCHSSNRIRHAVEHPTSVMLALSIPQDVKNGVLREYAWGDMIFNYGAMPQTWEVSNLSRTTTIHMGGNRPTDVAEVVRHRGI